MDKLLHFRTLSMCSMYKSAIKFYNLEIEYIDTTTLGGKIKRARKLYGLTQDSLAKLTGISAPTIHELERNINSNCTRVTLNKLCKVFPKELILTDYHKFIYRQDLYLKDVDPYLLSSALGLIPSTIKRWQNCTYIVRYDYYIKIKELGLI